MVSTEREPGRAARQQRGKGVMLAGLRGAREDAGYSLRALEARTGEIGDKVYASTISELENGKRGAQWQTARTLAEALGVKVKDLRGDG